MTDATNTAPAPAGGDGGAPAAAPASGGSPAPGGGAPPDSSNTGGAPASGGAPAGGAPVGGDGGAPPSGTAATLAGGGTTETPATPQTWPDDWRAKLAGDDKAFLKRLERFTDPGAVAKSYRELEAKLAAPKVSAPPADATAEQVAAWRKDQGLPETPDAYITGLEMPDGVVFGEADQPVLQKFAATAHEMNIPPAQFKGLLATYTAIQAEQAQAQRVQDAAAKNATLIELTKKWGGETQGNINAIPSVFADAPDGVMDQVLTARMPDGSILGNSPAALRWLSGLAREINPMAAYVPPGGGDAMKGGEARIAEIEGYMSGPDAQELYWSKPAVQEEIRNLYEARDKLKARRG